MYCPKHTDYVDINTICWRRAQQTLPLPGILFCIYKKNRDSFCLSSTQTRKNKLACCCPRLSVPAGLQSAEHHDCASDANDDDSATLARMGGAGGRPLSGVGASGQLRLFNHPSAAAAFAATATIAGKKAGGPSTNWKRVLGCHPKQPVRDAPQLQCN